MIHRESIETRLEMEEYVTVKRFILESKSENKRDSFHGKGLSIVLRPHQTNLSFLHISNIYIPLHISHTSYCHEYEKGRAPHWTVTGPP